MLIILFAFFLLVLTVGIHYGFFKVLLHFFTVRGPASLKLMAVVIALFGAHLLEVIAYALVYHFSYLFPSIGGIEGAVLHENANALYLSLLAYSSLGTSEFQPTGWLRILVGFEALNGLLLITWSASITFLAMTELLGVNNGKQPNT